MTIVGDTASLRHGRAAAGPLASNNGSPGNDCLGQPETVANLFRYCRMRLSRGSTFALGYSSRSLFPFLQPLHHASCTVAAFPTLGGSHSLDVTPAAPGAGVFSPASPLFSSSLGVCHQSSQDSVVPAQQHSI